MTSDEIRKEADKYLFLPGWQMPSNDVRNIEDQFLDRLERKGFFDLIASTHAPKLPTRSEVEKCIYGNSALEGVDNLIAAGYATEDEPDVPEYTEDDVRELAEFLYNDDDPPTEYKYMARKALAAGYRKQT